MPGDGGELFFFFLSANSSGVSKQMHICTSERVLLPCVTASKYRDTQMWDRLREVNNHCGPVFNTPPNMAVRRSTGSEIRLIALCFQ